MHAFRLKLKELLYVLQSSDKSDPALLEAIGQTKDAIGEWHDWTELESISTQTLDRNGVEVKERIHTNVEAKLAHALSVATQLRQKYFNDNAVRKNRESGPPIKETQGHCRDRRSPNGGLNPGREREHSRRAKSAAALFSIKS